jgi:hypothetical protein
LAFRFLRILIDTCGDRPLKVGLTSLDQSELGEGRSQTIADKRTELLFMFIIKGRLTGFLGD